LERPDLVNINFVLAEHNETILTREHTKAETIVRSTDGAVVVQVETRWNARVGRSVVVVRIVNGLGWVRG
jgi:hypothetical protein